MKEKGGNILKYEEEKQAKSDTKAKCEQQNAWNNLEKRLPDKVRRSLFFCQ